MALQHQPQPFAQHWSEPLIGHLLTAQGSREVFAHFGAVDHAVVQGLLEKAEAASMASNDKISVRKRLFNVLVEGLENIHNHTSSEHQATAFALLVDSPNGYRLALGNALPVATAALLSHRVEVLNSMDEADLKAHYMTMLSNDSRTERGGAGLGLLTLARKSDRPITVRTRPLNGSTAYLLMEMSVLRPEPVSVAL